MAMSALPPKADISLDPSLVSATEQGGMIPCKFGEGTRRTEARDVSDRHRHSRRATTVSFTRPPIQIGAHAGTQFGNLVDGIGPDRECP
jgi:hypothetical protein